jgi:hypothetical protein
MRVDRDNMGRNKPYVPSILRYDVIHMFLKALTEKICDQYVFIYKITLNCQSRC